MSVIPQSRTRKAIKLDPEVRGVKKDAVVALTKATELFIAYLAMRSFKKVEERRGRSHRSMSALL